MKLSEEQKYVVREILKFQNNVTTLGGLAGTGKSTIVAALSYLLPKFAVVAYTGKASDVLRKKNITRSCTIHSLIYSPLKDSNGNIIHPIKFTKKYSLDCEGIIIDEASMISSDIFKDLTSYNIPLIFVGDHGQLEPIGSDINLMKNPDYRLETIHRNAGELAHFANWIRTGNNPSSFLSQKHVKIDSAFQFPDKGYAETDQVICAYNKTRVKINNIVRSYRGYTQPLEVGERIMFLKNNNPAGIFNGMQGIVTKIVKNNKMDILIDDLHLYKINYDKSQLGKAKYDIVFELNAPNPIDYCYGITNHKAQGSEYDFGVVLNQRCDLWDHIRWMYTAASRFKKHLYWLEY